MTHGLDVEGIRYYSAATLRGQVAACMAAWGMPTEHVEITALVIVDANECGIDSHGISLLTNYDRLRRAGRITLDPVIEVVRETPVSALIDAGGSLGYVPSVTATRMAIAMAKEQGLSAIAVRGSGHFGAAGYYTRMMADSGLIGVATSSGSGPRSAPTFGREPRLSTNPMAFAAPAKRNPAFSLDMATTTVASGKIRVRADEDVALPTGWAYGRDGEPMTDPHAFWADNAGMLSPLGGTPEGASYKGYGLGMMVEILSVGLTGESLVMAAGHGSTTPGRADIGHFFLALDPTMFRDEAGFEATVDDLIDHLHTTAPIEPQQPVLVAGEPENKVRASRAMTGIPIPPGLHGKLHEIAQASGAAFLLD